MAQRDRLAPDAGVGAGHVPSWTTKVVGYGPGGEPCNTSATDIDLINHPKGRPAIVITNQCTKEVTGFFLRKGQWVTQVLLEGAVGAFRYPALALAVDPASIGDVYGRGGLSVWEFSWSGRQVGDPEFFALPHPEVPYGGPALGFLPDGTGYLAFQAGSPPGTPAADAYTYLALLTRTAGTWGTRTAIDRRGPITGAEPSLSLAGGTLQVAYQDVTNSDLRYATSADGMTWRRTTVAGPNDTGSYPSLVVSETGNATIAYFDRTDTALLSVRGR